MNMLCGCGCGSEVVNESAADEAALFVYGG